MVNEELDLQDDVSPAPEAPLRSIQDIIKDLSKPVNPQRLKTKEIQTRRGGSYSVTYLPWYQCVQYLDHYAAGWRYEIRSVSQIGENLVMTVRLIIPCLEGDIWREASSLEPIDGTGYGDAATNAESAALRRAASKFGLCLYLYEK